MVRIIEKGKDPKEKTFRITCHNCKTIFEFEAFEATKGGGTYRDNHEYFYQLPCPVCNYRCTAYDKDELR